MKSHGAHLPFSHLLIYKILFFRLGQLTSQCQREEEERKSFTHFRRDQKNGKHLCRIEPEQIELTLMNERRETTREEERDFLSLVDQRKRNGLVDRRSMFSLSVCLSPQSTPYCSSLLFHHIESTHFVQVTFIFTPSKHV